MTSPSVFSYYVIMKNIAEIDLNILRENALKVKNTLPKNTKFCAVVKANAYGHGSVPCANAIYSIADRFAVCLVEEGVELRLGGIDKDILVLIPANNFDIKMAVKYRLTLTVDSLRSAKLIEDESKAQKTVSKVHIKVNTGMNRNGVDSLEEIKRIAEFIENSEYLSLDGVYSHYGMPEDDKILKQATDRFLLAINAVKGYNDKVTAHISASGGFIKGQYFDMVRIGILLYGYKPFKCDFNVKPVMNIKAPVIGTRKLGIGERALYGDFKTDKPTDIALIRYGYADGLFRKNVSGQFNNRCMDITAVTERKAVGEFYTVMENADLLAEKYGTISYEILCSAANRAERVYIN